MCFCVAYTGWMCVCSITQLFGCNVAMWQCCNISCTLSCLPVSTVESNVIEEHLFVETVFHVQVIQFETKLLTHFHFRPYGRLVDLSEVVEGILVKGFVAFGCLHHEVHTLLLTIILDLTRANRIHFFSEVFGNVPEVTFIFHITNFRNMVQCGVDV